jgi:hypothetical protein
MNELARIKPRDLLSHPDLIQPAILDAERIIELASLLHRWDEMEQAIDVLIERQQAAVAWWDQHVRQPGNQPNNPAPGLIGKADAERIITLRQQQISRFRSALANADTYRGHLIMRARHEAGIVVVSSDPTSQRPTPGREGEADFWPTPHSLIKPLIDIVLPILPPESAIWECATGDRRLALAMRDAGYDVLESDLHPQDGLSAPRDFLTVPPPMPGLVVVTNPPYNQSDAFIARGLGLLDAGEINGLILLLRHDHLQAAGRVEAFNRATQEIHCNWRPIWIDGSDGQPRWSFHWIVWLDQLRQPPFYMTEAAATG